MEGVGQLEDQGEFGLGVAARDSRPVHKIELTKEKEAELAEAQAYVEWEQSEAGDAEEDEQAIIGAARLKNKQKKKRKPIEKQPAFVEFKQEPEGQRLEESIRDNRAELKQIKM